jgi:hypothetical protein
MAQDLVNTLADLKEQEVMKIVKDKLSAGEDPLKERAWKSWAIALPAANISYLTWCIPVKYLKK